MNNAKLNKW